MGYFSSGSEGMDYEDKYCDRCINNQDEDEGCWIWGQHMLLNYDACNDKDHYLHVLIPRDEEGWNKECVMFRVDPTHKPDQ